MARSLKDAIVLCLDVGPGMTQSPPDEDTPLESSLKIIQLMVQRKIFSQSKDEISLVLFGTEDTCNELTDGDNYSHIHVLNLLSVPDFHLLEAIAKIEPGPEETDFLDAITVGLDILHKQTKGRKIAERRLVLFTNFDHGFSVDNLEGIMRGFNCENEEVQFNVIAPQFEESLNDSEEEESGSDGEGPSVKKRRRDSKHLLTEKPKTAQQRAGERVINQMLKEGEIDGCVYTYDQAVVALTYFEKKSVRPTPWKCNLELGTEFSIPCAAYVKCKAETLKKSWVKCYAKTRKPEDVTVQKYYHLQDEQHTEVDKEDIIKGYKYGKDVIPFSKEDEEQYKTEGKSLAILGFTDVENVPPQLVMDEQSYIIKTEQGDEHAAAALASLATAMHGLKMCAIARYVNRKGSNPKIAALIPRIKDTCRYLVMVYLPFAEDLRSIDFPSLSNAPGPSNEQLSAIDSLIDSMNLCTEEDELFKSQQMPNPYFQRVYHSLNHRALNPSNELSPPNEQIDNILAPNPQVTQRSSEVAILIENCFKLDKFVVKAKKSQKTDDEKKSAKIKSESKNGGAASDLLLLSEQLASREEVKIVGSVTPVQDFITLLKNTMDPQAVFEQLQQRILELVMDSSNAENRTVITCLRIMKEKAVAFNQINLYNAFLKNLRKTLKEDSEDNFYWTKIVSKDITLIECEEVSKKEVDSFHL